MMLMPGANPGDQVRVINVAEISPFRNWRMCLWILFLLSCLMVFRVQQDRYVEMMRRPGGFPDSGKPFLWEIAPFVNGNETFEATFLNPLDPQSASFAHLDAQRSTIISGPAPVLTHHDGGFIWHEDLDAKTTALAFASSMSTLGCPQNGSTCYLTTKKITMTGKDWGTCHRFLIGGSATSFKELGQGNTTMLCLRSRRIAAIVPDTTPDVVFLSWQPRGRARFLSCIARVSLSSFEVNPVATLELTYAVFRDDKTGFIIAVGYSAIRTLVVRVLQADTLALQWKFRLPLSIGWLIRSKASAGYVVFLGSEEPFLGTAFVVDLKLAHVYQQEPPSMMGGQRKSPRRRLPTAMVLEHPDPTENGRFFTSTKTGKDDVCAVGVY